jgi:aminoglycoside phosphotransferase (APT) family kinase protein
MTTPEWHADIDISEAAIRNILANQFPQLIIVSIKLIGEGWDNRVYLVNEQIIFRFPRRKVAVELITRENKLLPNLPQFCDLTIPIPIFIGQASADYPYIFQGYNLISGTSGYLANLSNDERNLSLPAIAKFLRQLHSIDSQKAILLGAEPQVFDRTEMDRAITVLQERVKTIIDKNICAINPELFQEEINTVKNLKLDFSEKCLVHGDLDCRHLLFKDKKLVGIIDWGDTGINHKAVDLSIIWNFYPTTQHTQFFEIYGEVDTVSWQYARFLGLYSAFTQILYGHDINDLALFSEAVNAVKRINSKLLF